MARGRVQEVSRGKRAVSTCSYYYTTAAATLRLYSLWREGGAHLHMHGMCMCMCMCMMHMACIW